MTIEITAEERRLLMSSIMSYKLVNLRYLEDFPESQVANETRKEVEISDLLYEKIFQAAFE